MVAGVIDAILSSSELIEGIQNEITNVPPPLSEEQQFRLGEMLNDPVLMDQLSDLPEIQELNLRYPKMPEGIPYPPSVVKQIQNDAMQYPELYLKLIKLTTTRYLEKLNFNQEGVPAFGSTGLPDGYAPPDFGSFNNGGPSDYSSDILESFGAMSMPGCLSKKYLKLELYIWLLILLALVVIVTFFVVYKKNHPVTRMMMQFGKKFKL
jgi:hypothetical protein